MTRSPQPESHRPRDFSEFIGQEKLKTRLQIHIKSALERGERLDHILLVGPPGVGKTSLAELIAQEAHVPFARHRMPIKPIQLRGLVRRHSGVLLLDEIHRSSKKEQEELLTFVEDGYLTTDIGELYNYTITVIAATTEPELVIPPLWDRFPIRPAFDDYTDAEMRRILKQMATKMNVELSDGSAATLARACGGVPRLAKDFVVMARDLHTDSTKEILKQLRVTSDGLSVEHLRYLRILTTAETCGLDILTTHLQLSRIAVVHLEKLLVKRGMLVYHKSGRVATAKAYQTMKENPNA